MKYEKPVMRIIDCFVAEIVTNSPYEPLTPEENGDGIVDEF